MSEDTSTAAARMRAALSAGLAPERLEIIDESAKHAGHAHVKARAGTAGAPGETHFLIKVVAQAFAGKSRLARHRAINALIADEMGEAKVHAVAIEARAPGELAPGEQAPGETP